MHARSDLAAPFWEAGCRPRPGNTERPRWLWPASHSSMEDGMPPHALGPLTVCVAMVPSRPRLANAHGGQPRSTAAAARAFGRLRNCIMLPSLCSNTRGPTVSSFRALSWCGQRHCSPVCPGVGALIGCVYIWTASPRHVAPASTSIHHRLFDENLRPPGQSARSVLAEHVACVPGAYMPCIFVLSRETGHEARPVLCTGWLVLHCQCLSRFVRGQSNHASDEPPIAVAVARELFS